MIGDSAAGETRQCPKCGSTELHQTPFVFWRDEQRMREWWCNQCGFIIRGPDPKSDKPSDDGKR